MIGDVLAALVIRYCNDSRESNGELENEILSFKFNIKIFSNALQAEKVFKNLLLYDSSDVTFKTLLISRNLIQLMNA